MRIAAATKSKTVRKKRGFERGLIFSWATGAYVFTFICIDAGSAGEAGLVPMYQMETSSVKLGKPEKD
jgi:hypothetical protein